MTYQLGAKPLSKPTMTLPEGANLCGIYFNFWPICAVVSIILMTYPVISNHFRYFFQCLQIQVEETYFFHEAIVIFTLRNWTKIQLKNIYILPIFIDFIQFLPFQVEEPISSSKPSQFPGSNGHVNSNETVKYWYSAQLCCCFFSLENYNFLQEKILPTRYSHIFKLFLIFTPVSSTSSGRNLFLPGSHHSFWFTSLGSNSNKVFIFSTFLAVVSLVLRITA